MIKDKQALEGGRISILGARVHNLKNIDVEIPRNKFGLRPEFLREYGETRCG